MQEHTASVLIPAPAKMQKTPGVLPIQKITSASVDQAFAKQLEPQLKKLFDTLQLPVRIVPDNGDIQFRVGSMADEAWQMQIQPDKITAVAGNAAGAAYAAGALAQMLFAATVKSHPEDALDCAEICDEPRYEWRGFMLDSARHFQDTGFVKKFLQILSVFRINKFHWHLVDSQGWRYPSVHASKLGADGKWSIGQYSLDELREISRFARDLGISIIPEIDVPGHSTMMLKNYPEYNCDPAHPGSEFCLGKPEVMEFIKKLIAELIEIFPDSPVIHLGGDEADTKHWEKCPDCQAAMKARGLQNMRELENAFMEELTRFVVEHGRTPMLWGPASEQVYPADTILQAWLNMRDPFRFAPHGNKVVYSVHHSLYFDYPAKLNEYWENWMLELSEQGVYITEPNVLPQLATDNILGTEACMWTETIPQHRISAKLFPRIIAYSECAWSLQENKSWTDYQRRRDILDAAGYWDYIKA